MSGVNSSTVDNQLGNKCLATGEEQFQHYGQFTPSVSILLAVLMILMVLATVLGNALVILAFVVDKGLRTQGNFFFLNLAIADFLVGEYFLHHNDSFRSCRPVVCNLWLSSMLAFWEL